MQAGMAPKPIMMRHILSEAFLQSSWAAQSAQETEDVRLPLKPTARMTAKMAAVSWPTPCMAKTALIMKPRHLVVANSEVMVALRG